MTVKTGNPETDALFVELREDTLANFTLPNDLLHDGLADKRTARCKSANNRVTSLAFALKRYEEQNDTTPSAHEIEKAEKLRRITAMRARLESQGEESEPELCDEIDEDLLYRKQLAFCAYAVRAGWMRFDDGDDE